MARYSSEGATATYTLCACRTSISSLLSTIRLQLLKTSAAEAGLVCMWTIYSRRVLAGVLFRLRINLLLTTTGGILPSRSARSIFPIRKAHAAGLHVCGHLRQEKTVRFKGTFCFALFLLCAITVALPATAQMDIACSGLTRTLFVNWPQLGFTSCGTRSNPNEFILSPTTVKNLQGKWHEVLADGGGASPAVVNGVMYVDAALYADEVEYIYALNANTGMFLWRQPIGVQTGSSSPAVANGLVFIGSLDNNVYAFDARTGASAWTFTTVDKVWGSPTVANGVVYIASWDGTTYALHAASGAQLWVHGGGGIAITERQPSPAAWCTPPRVMGPLACMH